MFSILCHNITPTIFHTTQVVTIKEPYMSVINIIYNHLLIRTHKYNAYVALMSAAFNISVILKCIFVIASRNAAIT